MSECTTIHDELGAYVDGELSPERSAALAEHLTTCAECARDYEHVLATVRTVRETMVRHRAPDTLRARIRASIREERPLQVAPPRRRWRIPWQAAAAALVLVATSSVLSVAVARRGAGSEPVADAVLTSHIRALMPDHLTDVRSNDQHNVKPWFNGRLDYSPTVPRLDDAGFPLLGGRLDYLRDRPVAVVVYARRQHVIDVYSWPADAGDEPVSPIESRHGYNLMHWRHGGVEQWIASDLNAAELRQFATLLRAGEGMR
jgi:mycothiol system anti-sigma-R factor